MGLAAALWLLYQQTFSFDYTYFDDTDYVLHNPAVLGGLSLQGAWWALTSFEVSNWHPLTWLSHMLDVSLFGTDPGWAHLHNVLLHGINSVLVYVLLLRLGATLVQGALLSLIFLAHPLHVESVAWIAERKDLLCALFYLASLLAYDRYRHRGGIGRYGAMLAAAVLALMAKPMAVSLPVIMLLMDLTVYRAPSASTLPGPGEFWQAMRRQLPLIALTAGACVLTLLAQQGAEAVAHIEAHSLTDRLETATSAYLVYLRQWLLPLNLVAFYPLELAGTTTAWLFGLLALLVPSGVVVWLWRRTVLTVLGWAWFLVTLLPVIGLVQVGEQAHADRYMYLPAIGLLLIGLALFGCVPRALARSALIVTAAFCVFLGALTYWQVATWKNQYTVFSRVLELEGPNHKAHIHLAAFFLRHNELARAEQHAMACIVLRPNLSDGHQALGNIALARREFAQAEQHYRRALALGPPLAVVFNNLGIALAQQGGHEAAMQAFTEAVRLEPELEAAWLNLQRHRDDAANGE